VLDACGVMPEQAARSVLGPLPWRFREATASRAGGLVLLLVLGVMWAGHAWEQRVERGRVQAAEARDAALPRRMVWVWERPEDLHALDPAVVGVAVLEETVRLGAGMVVVPRRQPMVLPEGIVRVGVVRIEALPGLAAHLGDTQMLRGVVAELVGVARRPGVAALQVDFDARQTERGWYRRLLKGVRREMPEGMPLEMTALVSWCSTDDWMGDLPVNQAVPMFFRMEPDRRRMRLEGDPAYAVREPKCTGSVGVSTREPWPEGARGKRMYVFANGGWAEDLPLLGTELPEMMRRARAQ
jgi:hypothetical protein